MHELFLKQLCELFEIKDLSSISLETELSSLPHWDSLAILGVVDLIDDKYGVILTSKDVQNCRQVKDIFELTRKRK